MKYQALFSSKDNSKINKSVVCCNFSLKGYCTVFQHVLISLEITGIV